MLPTFCKQTITRIRAGTKTSRGSDVPDWEHADTITVNGCSVQPGSTSLSLDGRVLGITDAMTLYAPPGADIRAGDHIVYDGQTFLAGEPRKWTSPTGALSNMQINLERWQG